MAKGKKQMTASEMGRKGGSVKVPKGFSMMKLSAHKAALKKSLEARLAKLTPEQRSEIARNAAKKRWDKKKAASPPKQSV